MYTSRNWEYADDAATTSTTDDVDVDVDVSTRGKRITVPFATRFADFNCASKAKRTPTSRPTRTAKCTNKTHLVPRSKGVLATLAYTHLPFCGEQTGLGPTFLANLIHSTSNSTNILNALHMQSAADRARLAVNVEASTTRQKVKGTFLYTYV